MAARNGGSITPHYAKLLKQYQSQGRLRILDCTTVTTAEWIADDGSWQLRFAREEKGKKMNGLLTAEYIIAATGAAPRFSEVPFLKNIAKEHGVAEHGGLPAISDSLQYGSLPLFCTGAFSALQVCLLYKAASSSPLTVLTPFSTFRLDREHSTWRVCEQQQIELLLDFKIWHWENPQRKKRHYKLSSSIPQSLLTLTLPFIICLSKRLLEYN